MKFTCRVCFSNELVEMIDLGNFPIAHRLLSNPDDTVPNYPFLVNFCKTCGLIQIAQPIDPKELYLNYNYCFSSWKDEPHAEDEIDMIFKQVQAQSIFEIACNDGKFLELLKHKGVEVLVGLEPNNFSSKLAKEKGFPVYSALLNEVLCRNIAAKFGKFDVVVAREVLEHMLDINTFFRCVDILLSDHGFLFIDTPDIENGLLMGDCSILWEEHPNCFTEDVLCNTLLRFGFEPISIKKYNFSGGVMGILARRTSPAVSGLAVNGLEEKASAFNQRVNNYKESLRRALSEQRKRESKIVLYGVGCRACTVVNILGLGKYIDFAIDDQLERQDKYMPASRLPIKSPEILKGLAGRLLVLLAVNQENESKVKNKLKTIKPDFISLSLFSPNDIWRELEKLRIN